jgi:hypothetical protein
VGGISSLACFPEIRLINDITGGDEEETAKGEDISYLSHF